MMSPTYVMDACALLAFFMNEPGADKTAEVLARAEQGSCMVFMHKVNLLETYYGLWKLLDQDAAEASLDQVVGTSIALIDGMSDGVFVEAARFKVSSRMSLADAILLAEARVRNATVVTCDHHEFDPIAAREPLTFLWIR